MKIYELIKDLNKKVQIKDKRVFEVKKHYLSLYRANMVYLYDKGYISDPTVFNRKEIMMNIVDMNIKYLSGVTGKIELTEDYIGFALAKYKDDEEISEFLSLLLDAIKYRNISLNIDKFYDDLGFAYESSKKFSLNLIQSASRIRTKSGFSIDEGILKCMKPFGVGVKFLDMNDVIYEMALKQLGIENNSDESIFVSGLTKEEEIKYSNIILNGLVKLDGKESQKLVDWLNNNKWAEGNKFSSQNEGLYNWVVYINSNDMIEEQSKFMNKLLDEGYEILSMESNGFYVLDTKSPVLFPVGIFVAMSGDEDEILPSKNVVEGYTGEVFSLNYLISNELSFVGCPIELYIDDKTKAFFVDKEQTEFNESISWFKDNKAIISFDESQYEEGVFPKGSLEDDMYKIVCDAEEGTLIGLLRQEVKGINLSNVKKAVARKF